MSAPLLLGGFGDEVRVRGRETKLDEEVSPVVRREGQGTSDACAGLAALTDLPLKLLVFVGRGLAEEVDTAVCADGKLDS